MNDNDQNKIIASLGMDAQNKWPQCTVGKIETDPTTVENNIKNSQKAKSRFIITQLFHSLVYAQRAPPTTTDTYTAVFIVVLFTIDRR